MPARLNRRQLIFGACVAWGATMGLGWVRTSTRARPHLLRPPGARDDFLATCIRCGQCVERCPIQILELAHGDEGAAAGTPYLVARKGACDLCAGRGDLACIQACPTDALAPVPHRRAVRMGLAVIDTTTCFAWQGVACRACWHACPYPDEAILLDARARAVVVNASCVGCGLCEHACLTEEPAIRVVPKDRAPEAASS